jgi:hypothetical protein
MTHFQVMEEFMPRTRHLTVALAALGLAALGCGRSEGPAPTSTASKATSPAKAAAFAHEVVIDVPGMT